METLTIEIPDKETKIVKEILKKFNVTVVKSERSRTPNALTLKTIKDAHEGKNIGPPIENVHAYLDSL